MSWINVKDQLPSDNNDVLAYSPEDGCFRAWFENNIWLSHEPNNTSRPTHWMAMPEEPNEKMTPSSVSSAGMTDNLISNDNRPISIWSETVDTANDIRKAWEQRFGGPYTIVKSKQGYEVKYTGKWLNNPVTSHNQTTN